MLLAPTQTQHLLFLLRCYDEPVLFKGALEIAFRLIFIFRVAVTGSGTTMNAWRRLSQYVAQQKKSLPSSDLVLEMQRKAQKELKDFWDNSFVQAYEALHITKDKNKVKMCLRVIESFLSVETKDEKGHYHKLYFEKDDVDHLEAEKADHGLNEKIIQSIGNAALLRRGHNRSVQKARFASAEKKRALRNSEYLLTKNVVKNVADFTTKAEKQVAGKLTTIDEITEGTVAGRRKEMLKILEEGILQ